MGRRYNLELLRECLQILKEIIRPAPYPEFIFEGTTHSYLMSVKPEYRPTPYPMFPIRVLKGDTFDVTWDIDINYDPERRVISIYSGGEYKGTIAAEDGFRSVHKMYGRYNIPRE